MCALGWCRVTQERRGRLTRRSKNDLHEKTAEAQARQAEGLATQGTVAPGGCFVEGPSLSQGLRGHLRMSGLRTWRRGRPGEMVLQASEVWDTWDLGRGEAPLL